MFTSPTQPSSVARTAGTICLVGGLLGVVLDVFSLLNGSGEVSLARNLSYVAIQLMVLVGLAAPAVLGAVGSSWWGRVGLGVAILSWVVLIAGELIEPFDPATATAIFELVPLTFGPGMLLAGVAVLRARRWSGWRRFVPLALGVYTLAVFLPVVIVAGSEAGFWVAVTGLDMTFAVLGLAIVQQASATVGPRETTPAA